MAELPIVCTLGPADGAERLARWQGLRAAGASVRATDAGFTAEFRNDRAVADELFDLVRLERECCGFASWRIDAGGDTLRLEVRAADKTGAEALWAMLGLADAV